MRGLRDDLYLVLAVADPKTKRATFTFHVNPFVGWIWIGLGILCGGCLVSLWPEVTTRRVTAWSYVRASLGATAGILFTFLLATSLSQPFSKSFVVTEAGRSAFVQSSSDLTSFDAGSLLPIKAQK
jgi:cytochrome c biogenesis factor